MPVLAARFELAIRRLRSSVGAQNSRTRYWPPGIGPFAYLGLVADVMAPKPALAAWDAEFAKRLQ